MVTIKDRQQDVEGSRLIVITMKRVAQELAPGDTESAEGTASPMRKRTSSIRIGHKADSSYLEESEHEEEEEEEEAEQEQGGVQSAGHRMVPGKTYTLRAKTVEEAKVFKETLERTFVDWQNRGKAPPTRWEKLNDRARKLAHSPRLQFSVFGLIVVNIT